MAFHGDIPNGNAHTKQMIRMRNSIAMMYRWLCATIVQRFNTGSIQAITHLQACTVPRNLEARIIFSEYYGH
jgi:hypothetical protein